MSQFWRFATLKASTSSSSRERPSDTIFDSRASTCQKSSPRAELRPTPIGRYEELLGVEKASQLLWGGYGIISGGRAGYKLGHLVETQPAEAFAHENCAGNILYAHHSHMDLFGNYIPAFCGGLTAADWRDEDPLRRPYPELLELLIESGPSGLFEMAQNRYDYRPLPIGYAGKCHLCVDVRWHLVRVKGDDYPELRPARFYENV